MPKAKICRRRGQRMLQRLITRRISHAQVLQYTAGKPIFCRGHLQRSPRCKCVRPSGKLAAPGVSENKLLARRCRKLTGQRQNGKRQPPPVKLLPKRSCCQSKVVATVAAAAHCVCTGCHYNTIYDPQLQNSITHPPAAARNLDATIPLRSAETELQKHKLQLQNRISEKRPF